MPKIGIPMSKTACSQKEKKFLKMFQPDAWVICLCAKLFLSIYIYIYIYIYRERERERERDRERESQSHPQSPFRNLQVLFLMISGSIEYN